MNTHRVITFVYVALFSVFGVGAVALFVDAYARYDQLKQIETATRRKLAEVQAQLRQQEQILQRLRTDPAFVEKVIRRRLNYESPGTVIFRFPE